ncbi:branched-chain amino acid transport system II carrier protein [Persicobacter psychrovividus]|uniref:Branched-chain amino acid transport system carrier protein n=1 Tax=Persicobacter psychrovividus TaxID=387638 RepID=A0ABN6L8D6_9BACT|nr:branched-chain amino acid transport system carrier protein [Persicobacter psychrovividus]
MNALKKDTLVAGLALFAMFFGAGNLIFPPSIGFNTGSAWVWSLLGFLITGVGLILLGIIAVAKSGGTVDTFSQRVTPWFGKLLGTLIILAIGPMLAIPRTGAVTYELAFAPHFEVAIQPVTAVFFLITIIFAIKPTGIIDRIGQILAPVLVVAMAAIVIYGIIKPIGTPIDLPTSAPFSKGFTDGYQTMDVLAAILFGGLTFAALKNKGYNTFQQQMNITVKAGMIAAAGLVFIYGGLLYIGATASGVFPKDITTSALLLGVVNHILGKPGMVLIAIAITFACLTTSVGLTATVGEFFHKLSSGKIPYAALVVATSLFSWYFSTKGVDELIKFAVPVLSILYPVTIALIFLNLLGNHLPDWAFKVTTWVTLAMSIFSQIISALSLNLDLLQHLQNYLPFVIYPALTIMVLFLFISNQQKGISFTKN